MEVEGEEGQLEEVAEGPKRRYEERYHLRGGYGLGGQPFRTRNRPSQEVQERRPQVSELKASVSEGNDQDPAFLADWNSPEILKARAEMKRRNGLRKWFNAALKGAK